ncbi:MAG: ParB/RepB/Spo0J family partition protein [Proteobacteria bacterium]|nr:ParB/RepB/Spo0J family partition protein [Pseudomonadota bacterium]MBU1737494.1 ParB/RepB/Spo0J family partition protein [Pseudomonadota bacterium]
MVKHSALGKGLNALLPSDGNDNINDTATGTLISCAIDRIVPNPYQPRKEMDQEALRQLADSIKEKGVLQPLIVRKKDDGDYELVAGERRLQAATIAGLEKVPVIIREIEHSDRLELAIIENIQRQDLSPLDEAEAYQRLMSEFGETQESVAKKVGKQRSTIANALRLLQLPEFAKSELASGRISSGHARVLLSCPDEHTMRSLCEEILSNGLSVRQAEALARKLKPGIQRKNLNQNSAKSSEDLIPESYCKALENDLVRHLDTKSRIIQNGSRGKVEIEYFSMDDLERLVSLITGNQTIS